MDDGLSHLQLERRRDLRLLAEAVYMQELSEGVKPQQARDNLLTCLKTEIVCTYNAREWRHFFTLRTADTAHPQMRKITRPLLAVFRIRVPVLFDDVGVAW
jgi:thymidylate synthase (FAD)